MGMGFITTEHTAWCGVCEFWVQICECTKAQTEEIAKKEGWREIKGSWTCPDCVKKIKNG